eukprot:scaffold44342_cov21-Tisochrysis_lutea.AAC.3
MSSTKEDEQQLVPATRTTTASSHRQAIFAVAVHAQEGAMWKANGCSKHCPWLSDVLRGREVTSMSSSGASAQRWHTQGQGYRLYHNESHF